MRYRKKFLLIILIFISIMSISATASAKEITVDDGSGADFRSIQEAINHSVPGDTIIVGSGTYTENVLVNVTGLTIRSESNNGNAQVKPLEESVSTFLIEADNITISGFNITGPSQDYEKSAIFVYGDMNNLTGNTIENGCILLGPERRGNLITENKINGGDQISNGESEGIHISCCGFDTNIVSNNTISNCSIGIYEYDQAAEIHNNRITDCDYGIELTTSSSGIDNNTILNCNVGIKLGEACPVYIINNTILSCSDCGILDTERDGSKRIYNNYFNNTLNVRFEAGEGGNTWNNSLTEGTNIVGGPYIGGNFWAKPDGTGFSQTCVDLDGNGIGDLPYNIYEDEFDYLPLVSLSSLQSSVTPTANFTASVTNGYAPLSIQFNDSSENTTEWNWDFGDGFTSTEQNPTHTYHAVGNYTVNLTVTNENGIDSKSATINVSEKPVPVIHWEFSPQEPVSGDTLNINGNASPREKVDAFVTFEKLVPVSEGKFECTLENVTIPEGLDNLFTVEARGINNLHVRVKMVLWATKSSGASGGTATVSQSNVPPGNYTIKIDGDAGEGVSEVNLKITAFKGIKADSNGNFSYSYNTTAVPPGNFEVKVGGITKEITLGPKEIEEPPLVLPISNFSSNVTEGYAPLNVQFTDLSENTTGWHWDFGDGANSSDQNPLHLYSNAGIYTVNLTAANENGTASKSAKITVSEKSAPVIPVANFTANKTEGIIPHTVKFTDTSTNSPTGWEWNFGDGNTSTEQSPEHTFSGVGIYDVTLVATNDNGSSSVKSMNITVNRVPKSPVANFTANLTVKFTDISTNSPTRWEWNFGDGTATSTEQNPVHVYSGEGTYHVTLIATNAGGSSYVRSMDITVNRVLTPPVADFTADKTEGTTPLTVKFTDTSTNSPTGWEWNFGDGAQTSTEQNPEHNSVAKEHTMLHWLQQTVMAPAMKNQWSSP